MDVFLAWTVYFSLKCVVVVSATRIGEGLGVLLVSAEKGLEMAWAAWAVYYTVVGGIAVLLFRWTVHRFVVSRRIREEPLHLSLLTYGRVWLVYAIVTTALGFLLSRALEYTILDLVAGRWVEAPWTGWLRNSVQPVSVILVSLLVFRWTVTKLLLRDRTAPASPIEVPGRGTERE